MIAVCDHFEPLHDTDKAGAEVVRNRIEEAVGVQELAPGVSTFISNGGSLPDLVRVAREHRGDAVIGKLG